MRNGGPPALWTRVGPRWLKPFFVPDLGFPSGLCQLDDEHWLVVGRGVRGGALAYRYAPLQLDLEALTVPDCRALLACASRCGRGVALAVGAEGGVLAVEGQQATPWSMPGRHDLTALALDATGTAWLAGAGRVWARERSGSVQPVWSDDTWRAPFVALHAEASHALALTVDGGVLELGLADVGSTAPA